jgi:hypothetical protein
MKNKKLLSAKKHTHRAAQDILKENNDLKEENQKLKDLILDIFKILEKKS